jgi:hypothetical protein
MKKSISIEKEICSIKSTTNELDQTSVDPIEGEDENSDSRKVCVPFDFSFCSIISVAFIVILVAAVAIKIFFPAIDSIQANIEHKMIGKSIVYNFYSLLEGSNYADALKLIDSQGSGFDVDSLTSGLKAQIGTTDIVGCDILDVIGKEDQSVVNTVISYIQNGQVQTKNQSVLVKNTPSGWKISLDGLVKRFKVKPLLVTIGKVISFTPQEIEYCKEGINLKIKIRNNIYKKVGINGLLTLKTTTGEFSKQIKTVVKSQVQYDHNMLFDNASGEPEKLIISLNGKGFEKSEIPLKIIR